MNMGPKLKAKIVNVWIEGRRGRKKFTMDENNEYNENNPDPDPDCGTPGPRPPSGGPLLDGETGGEGRRCDVARDVKKTRGHGRVNKFLSSESANLFIGFIGFIGFIHYVDMECTIAAVRRRGTRAAWPRERRAVARKFRERVLAPNGATGSAI